MSTRAESPVVLVTGAGRGLGRAVGERFRSDGYRVVATDSHPLSRTVSPMDVNGPVGRVVQRVAGSGAFAPVAKHVVPRLDRVLNRVTGGRFVLSALLVPSLVLTARGAKSGQPRTTPLATLPDDDGSFLVVGSNFGQPRHPAWTANLLANPDATVTYGGRRLPVRARLLEGDERAQAWPRLTQVWPVYDRYVEMSGRDLRVFRLTPG